MSLHFWHTGSCLGSRDGTHTWPHRASSGVPSTRAASTLAAASSPGSVLTMWAMGPSSVSRSSSVRVMVVVAGPVVMGAVMGWVMSALSPTGALRTRPRPACTR